MPHAGEALSLLAELQKVKWKLAVRYDEVSASLSYVGEAWPGSSELDAVWRIQEVTTVGADVTIKWAAGSAEFNQVWNDRASLTYS